MNFRVTDEEWEVLRALANLAEQTVPTAAYEIVQRAIEVAREDPLVQTDIANRRAARRAQGGDVVAFRPAVGEEPGRRQRKR